MLEWEVGAMKVQRAWPIKEGALSQLPPVLLSSATNVVNCYKCSELQTQLMSVGQDFTFYSPSMLPTQKHSPTEFIKVPLWQTVLPTCSKFIELSYLFCRISAFEFVSPSGLGAWQNG